MEVILLQTATIFGQEENPTFVVSNKQKSLQNHLSLQKLVTICEQNHILTQLSTNLLKILSGPGNSVAIVHFIIILMKQSCNNVQGTIVL